MPPYSYRTPSRLRFFDAFDAKPKDQSMIDFCNQNKSYPWCPSQPTASRWLRDRQQQLEDPEGPSPGRCKRRKQRGVKKRDLSTVIDFMACGPTTLRKKDYQYWQDVSKASYTTLKRRMNERKPPVIRSRRRKTTEISQANKDLRKEYGLKYRDETAESLWQWIHWTDEAHLDRAQAIDQWIFREKGNLEGLLMEQPSAGSLVLHIAASVSWHHKSELIFYNDDHWNNEHIRELWQSQKPRRNRRNKSEKDFQIELLQWKNSQPPETVKKGNSMTQVYYSQQILPQHMDYIYKQKAAGLPAILMEDGDPSHGHRSDENMAHLARVKARIQLHDHPPQSPDLNPIEGVWLLLNERLKQIYNNEIASMDYFALKEAIKAAWNCITLEEIRNRIRDMPYRCCELVKTGGQRVKGAKW